jgi:hypothetical protein
MMRVRDGVRVRSGGDSFLFWPITQNLPETNVRETSEEHGTNYQAGAE